MAYTAGAWSNLVFPAQAGMNRNSEIPKGRICGVPRAGGDEPSALIAIICNWAGVPRAGGDEPASPESGILIGMVFPAQAGMNR